jgi:hypothetical protein
MRNKIVTLIAMCIIVLTWPIAQQVQTNLSSMDSAKETKTFESRKNGKYKRTTETFIDETIVVRKEEVSLKDNGQTDYVFIKCFRDGKMTYASTFYATVNRTIRSYYNQGKMIVMEGDEDGDGFFETMILFDTKEQPVEAFSKSKDGRVTPFTNEKLAELKMSFTKFQE